MGENAEPTPGAAKRQLDRLFRTAVVILIVLVALTFIWSWQWAASAAVGGGTILLAASATSTAVAGGGAERRKLVSRLWFRLSWRLLLLALCLYAMLQAPWVRLVPLLLGLALFFPALVVELILEQSVDKKPEEDSPHQGLHNKDTH
jgi:diacylglycerol kinase